MTPELNASQRHMLTAIGTEPQTLREVACMALTALTIQHHGFRKLVAEEIADRLGRPTRTPEKIAQIAELIQCHESWGADARTLLEARRLVGEVGTGYTVTKEQAQMFFDTIMVDFSRITLEEALKKTSNPS